MSVNCENRIIFEWVPTIFDVPPLGCFWCAEMKSSFPKPLIVLGMCRVEIWQSCENTKSHQEIKYQWVVPREGNEAVFCCLTHFQNMFCLICKDRVLGKAQPCSLTNLRHVCWECNSSLLTSKYFPVRQLGDRKDTDRIWFFAAIRPRFF